MLGVCDAVVFGVGSVGSGSGFCGGSGGGIEVEVGGAMSDTSNGLLLLLAYS